MCLCVRARAVFFQKKNTCINIFKAVFSFKSINRFYKVDCQHKVAHTPTDCSRPTALTPTSRLVCVPKSAGVCIALMQETSNIVRL